jgi:hypothetical protein
MTPSSMLINGLMFKSVPTRCLALPIRPPMYKYLSVSAVWIMRAMGINLLTDRDDIRYRFTSQRRSRSFDDHPAMTHRDIERVDHLDR